MPIRIETVSIKTKQKKRKQYPENPITVYEVYKKKKKIMKKYAIKTQQKENKISSSL